MKKILSLLTLAITLFVAWGGLSHTVFAAGSTVGKVDIVADGLRAKISLSGVLSAEDYDFYKSPTAVFLFQYGPYTEELTSIKFTGNGSCVVSDKDRSYVCSATGLESGVYAYSVNLWIPPRDVGTSGAYVEAISRPLFTGYRLFTVTPNESGSTSVSFGSVSVSGKDARVTVNIKHVIVKGEGYIQLGSASQVGTTANYVCIPSEYSSPALSVNPTTGDIAVPISYTFPNLTDGNYCVRVQAKFPGVGLQNIGDPAVTDENGYFKGRETLFSIGTATLAVGATNDSSANPSGCVTKGDNSNYCMLAPLPGLGDGSGDLDVTKGFGDYMLTIIRIVMGVIGILCVIMLVVGGIEYMSTVSVGEKEGAKSRIQSALFGLLLALSSYVILRTLNPKLVDLGVTIPTTQLTLEGDEGPEVSDVTPTNLPSVSDVSVPTGTAAELAKKILANPNVRFTVLKDEPKATPRQNIQDTADGKSAWTSVRGDVGSRQVALSEQMLGAILAAAAKTSITITEIAGGDHSKNSAHYAGRAMDIAATPGDLGRNTAIMNACRAAGAKPSQIFGPCNNVYQPGGKFTQCAATKYLTNKDHQTHIHCGW